MQAHALARHPMLANRLLRALHRPVLPNRCYVCGCATVCSFVCASRIVRSLRGCDTRASTHTRNAVLRRGANQWRNCKPVHPRVHASVDVDFQSSISLPPHSLDRYLSSFFFWLSSELYGTLPFPYFELFFCFLFLFFFFSLEL